MNKTSVEFAGRAVSGFHEGVRAGEVPGLLVGPGDVVLKGAALDSPLTPTTDLDGGKLLPTHQGINLGTGNIEHFGHIGKCQEALFYSHLINFAMSWCWFGSFGSGSVDLKGC